MGCNRFEQQEEENPQFFSQIGRRQAMAAVDRQRDDSLP
jgi:hypothetical protein